jgi:hypothetical protein
MISISNSLTDKLLHKTMIAMKPEDTTLLGRLTQADVVCRDCGSKYGKYSVGCSSMWEGTCDVCGETKPITEVRDWGYLGKGIQELNAQRSAQPFSNLTENFTPERKERIKEQSAKVADYMLSVGPIMNDDELEDCLTASYEQGEITCKFTEEEVAFLNECLDVIVDNHESLCAGHSNENPDDIALFESIEKKITDLYENHCVRYSLSPALRKYNEIYGTWGHENDEEQKRWDIFREAFVAGAQLTREQ